MTVPLKMKDLEAQTGVSRESIHFYLREGLLPEPERPKRNVAHYSDEHVVRIKAIKQLQQERSLSLDSIRTVLQDFDYDALSTGDNLARFELTVLSHVNGDLPARNQNLETVSARTGISVEELRELDELGVIHIQNQNQRRADELDFQDIGIIEQWARVLELGFEGKAGYDAHYLQRYADALKTIAELEVDDFLSAFSDMPSEQAAELAARGIGITNEILARLRTQALMRVLHDRAGESGP